MTNLLIDTRFVEFCFHPTVNGQTPTPEGYQAKLFKYVQCKDKLHRVKPERITAHGNLFRRVSAQTVDFSSKCGIDFKQALSRRIQALEHFKPTNFAVDKRRFSCKAGDVIVGRRIEKDEISKPRQVRIGRRGNDKCVGNVSRRGIEEVAIEILQFLVKTQGASIRGNEAQPVRTRLYFLFD